MIFWWPYSVAFLWYGRLFTLKCCSVLEYLYQKSDQFECFTRPSMWAWQLVDLLIEAFSSGFRRVLLCDSPRTSQPNLCLCPWYLCPMSLIFVPLIFVLLIFVLLICVPLIFMPLIFVPLIFVPRPPDICAPDICAPCPWYLCPWYLCP